MNIRRSLRASAALLVLCLVPLTGAAGDKPPITLDAAAIDTLFDDTMARYGLPGLAVGVVVDGEVVYQRTAGELRAGEGEAITSRSLFKVASNTKAMTTALLARLVDRGLLAWDDPVVKHLPAFRMHDPWVTREIQVRDLLIHNSGLGPGAGDLMLWPEPNHFTREDVVAGLAHLKPLHSFRSRYAYDNTLYIVAGEVAAAAGGASYEELMEREVFAPLGMSRCEAGAFDRDAVGDVAQPHRRVGGRNLVYREDGATVDTVPMAAAGGVRCSLDDMLVWTRMWLQPGQHGVVDGRPWLSDARRRELWTLHTPMPLGSRMRDWDGSRFYGYGYGWRLNDAHGRLKVSHTGTLSGMYSALTLLPELDAGFVMMTNGSGDGARTVLVQALSDLLVRPGGARPVAWYADVLQRERDEAPPARRAPDTSAREAVSTGDPAIPTGVYRDPWFGDVRLCAHERGVEFASAKSPTLTGLLMRLDDRVFVDWFDDSIGTDAWVEFKVDDGRPRMTMAKVDPEADFSYDFEDLAFERVAPCP
ncbi:serine hydrolase [Luteimonas yindakuii]|uniref:Serine hydrolase n=1 Tax=Luteimonas yindakuii TaxID=2565782 RepID=A0A4Z1RBS9_9GAMM|nr:serine hydrolase [Luteimonas yindakuii]TKS53623.1 serine hydrolase [Luteimonas yindakuii]